MDDNSEDRSEIMCSSKRVTLFGFVEGNMEISFRRQSYMDSINITERDNILCFSYLNNLPLFFTVVPSSIFMFLSCRSFVVITLSTGLVGVEVTSVSWLGQLTVGV